MSATIEIDKPRIEFGQIQGIENTNHQLGMGLEHADQITAFDDELLDFPSFSTTGEIDIVDFNSNDSKESETTNHKQLDFGMIPSEDVHHDSLWLNFQIARHRNRNFLVTSRISRRKSR